MSLPKVAADPDILRVCDAVGRGHLRCYDGINLMQDKMRQLLAGCTDINKMSVMAVLVTEQLNPSSKGLLLDDVTMGQMWQLPQESNESHPELHMSFLVLSCLQLTSLGERHEGAKAMTKALDEMLPEQPTIVKDDKH